MPTTPLRGRRLRLEQSGHSRERLELVLVVVHRIEDELAGSRGGEIAQLLGARLRWSADGDAPRQPGGVVHSVEDRSEAAACTLHGVLDCDVNALADRERLGGSARLVQLVGDDA